MSCTIYASAYAKEGVTLTLENYRAAQHASSTVTIISRIRSGELTKEEKAKYKATIPTTMLMASCPGTRCDENAVPNGLVMCDFDHVGDARRVYEEHIAPHREEIGEMLSHVTVSGDGIRTVAKWHEGCTKIAENQEYIAHICGLEEYLDPACKNLSRLSFITLEEDELYIDEDIFSYEPPEWFSEIRETYAATAAQEKTTKKVTKKINTMSTSTTTTLQPEEQYQTEYNGIALREIAEVALELDGGVPPEGHRHTTLLKLANKLGYITDFQSSAIYHALPHCGLPDDEVWQICASACEHQKGLNGLHISEDLQKALDLLKESDEVTEEEALSTKVDFPLPPLFREYYKAAPEDFKKAVLYSLLPMAGTLASRLRALYNDGRMHSPEFLTIITAPFASGKSLIGDVSERVMTPVKEMDTLELQREREQERDKRLAIYRNEDDFSAFEEDTPPLVRCLGATISATQFLHRMHNAQGCHCYTYAPELDQVRQSFSKSTNNLTAMLRVAFDNAEWGQDYFNKTETFSGNVSLYYNVVYTCTPGSLASFMGGTRDIENGYVSRYLIAEIPDTFGKPMPKWSPMTAREEEIVNQAIKKLNDVTIRDGEVLPEHVMDLAFLNKKMEQWTDTQRKIAVNTNDHARDKYSHRAAVVGFRAGMLAYYLYEERNTRAIRANVCKFAYFVANNMLSELCNRYPFATEKRKKTAIGWEAVYNDLGDVFTREDLEAALQMHGVNTKYNTVINFWKKSGIVEADRKYDATCFSKISKCNC